jgi:hypothetical protein
VTYDDREPIPAIKFKVMEVRAPVAGGRLKMLYIEGRVSEQAAGNIRDFFLSEVQGSESPWKIQIKRLLWNGTHRCTDLSP